MDASSPLSDKERARIRKAVRYALYTYPIVTIKKENVDKVNSCFLNEVTEGVAFRNPPAMIRTIRQWRKYLLTFGFLPNIFPPNILPTYRSQLYSSVAEFMENTFQHLDVNQLLRPFDYLDVLESELTKEMNRIHGDCTLQNGEIKDKSDGCWLCEKSDQPTKLSWRRSGRANKSERESE